jgi:hypothetical protein
MPFCLVPQPRLVRAEYFASKLVVEATLLHTRTVHDARDPELVTSHLYTLRVDRVLRGEAKMTLRVDEGNDSGRAAFDWVHGRKYLLFLFPERGTSYWALDGCGNSGPLSMARKALGEIAKIKSTHDSLIQGVVSESALSVPISGVLVKAIGTAGSYAAMTDAKGEFRLKVAPGSYIVYALKRGLSFGKADISYEDPRHVYIQPGGCAQIQFVGRLPSKN